jgi:hypothetical protein
MVVASDGSIAPKLAVLGWLGLNVQVCAKAGAGTQSANASRAMNFAPAPAVTLAIARFAPLIATPSFT